MKFQSAKQWVVCSLLCALIFGMGCKGGNIFGLRDPSESNVSDLIAKGQKLMRDGKFDEAEVILAKAVEAAPLNSDARFYHAKAVLQASDISVVALIRDVTDNLNKPGSKVPLYTRETGVATATEEANKTKIYQTMRAIIQDLGPIGDGLTIGTFDSASVRLDLALAYAVYGFLQLRDTNGDGEIKSDDLYLDFAIAGSSGDLDFNFGDLDDVINPPGLTLEQQRARGESFNQVLLSLIESNPNDPGVSTRITGAPGVFGANPGNPSIIDQILKNIEQSGLLSSDTSIDIEELKRIVRDMGDTVKIYFINTGADAYPNNAGIGDNDNDGKIDEEIINGVDDDNDGNTDEDSKI